jgi:hypothetical protein
MTLPRRQFLRWASLVVPVASVRAETASTAYAEEASAADGVNTLFPTQSPELVQEMVVVAHFNVARVKELVGRQATLAKATWDWGFGDWETALGAASHTGNREIAEILLRNGAHPTIFSAAMLGQLDVVKAFVAAVPAVQRTRGPHSISLLAHAKAGGAPAQSVFEYLKSIEGADDKVATQPLTDADIVRLTGAYTFGVTPADRVEITASQRLLQFGRPGRFARALFHLGGFEFCPMGAENVRVKFAETAGAMVLTVHDPDVVLTARKAAQ